MESIGEICGVITGGISEVYLLDVNDVLSIPKPSEDFNITSAMLLKAGASFGKMNVQMKSALFEEKGQPTSHGDLYTLRAEFTTVFISPEVQVWKNKNMRRKFIIVIKDFNNQTFLLGNLDYPMRLRNIDSTTNTGPKQVHGSKFVFVGQNPQATSFYLMSEVVDGGYRRIFDTTFDLTFN